MPVAAQGSHRAHPWLSSAPWEGLAAGIETALLRTGRVRQAHLRSHPHHSPSPSHRHSPSHSPSSSHRPSHSHIQMHMHKAVPAGRMASHAAQHPAEQHHWKLPKGQRRTPWPQWGGVSTRAAAPGVAVVCQGKGGGRGGPRHALGTGPGGGGARACAWRW